MTDSDEYPSIGRFRGGFRTTDGLQPTDRTIAHADADIGMSAETDASSWLFESDTFEQTLVAVDVAPDGAVLLFVEGTADSRTAGATIRLEPDAAGSVASGLLVAADSVTETGDDQR
jgi:hypothetical protein